MRLPAYLLIWRVMQVYALQGDVLMTRGMFLIACAAGALFTTSAQAGNWRDRETRSIAVDAADLDLSTDPGLDALSYRIGHAVRRICGSDRECEDEAWASTEGQVAWAMNQAEWRRRWIEPRAPEPVRYLPPCPPGDYGVRVVILQGPVVWRR